jgi:hydrophobe/amphiphile efflux-3 (HAE3) family protein
MNLKKIPLWIVDNPLLSAAIILVITVFFALQLPRLEIDASSEGLMVEKDPARLYYEEIKKKFGSDNLTVVVVKAGDVFSKEVLETIQRLSNSLQGTPGVSRVESLTTVNNIKGEGDFLNTDPLVGADIPDDPAKLKKIRSDALGNTIFINNIVSKDGKVAAINAYTEAKAGDKAFNPSFTKLVDSLIEKEKREGVEIYQIGTPLTKVTLGEYIQGDMVWLVPLAIAFLFLTLFLTFRTIQGVAIPMATGLVSIIWVLGEMVLIGYPVNVITAIIPALMVAIGFTEDSHMISEYMHELEQGAEKAEAVRTVAVQTALPVLITTFTTVIGFGSLVTSDITMLIQFGVASALGLTSNWIISAVIVPVMLIYWPAPKVAKAQHVTEQGERVTPMALFMRKVGQWDYRWRWQIIIVSGALTAASLWGWYIMEVNTDFISFFKETTFIRKRVKDVHESLSGVINFYIVVETGKEDGTKEPDNLRHVAKLQEHLKGLTNVDNSISLANYVRMMHREMNESKPDFEVVPDKKELIAQYILTLDNNEINKYVDYNYSTFNISVRHNITSSFQLSQLLGQIKAYVDKSFPKNLKVQFTGEGILINNAADYMALNQVTGFGQTFLVIGLIHAAMFMSFKAGFISLLPNVIPIVFNFGLMGFLGIPLNVGTSMIAAIALGIAVDDTVHFMVHYSRELNEVHEQEAATYRTLEALGRPIIYSSIALAAGFVILMFSNFIPTIYFGVLSAVVMIVAMVAEMTFTPILMMTTRLVTVWDTLLAKMNKDIVGTTPIFHNFWLWEAKKVAVMGKLSTFKKGETMVRKGDIGNEMYLIITGRASVTDSSAHGGVIKTLDPGEIFGEMALVEQTVRAADVVAEEDVELLGIDGNALERLRKRFPYTAAKLFLNLSRIISGRLRETTEKLTHAV